MSFIDGIKERARKEIKTIVLPEADDLRVLKATEQIIKEEFAKIVLIGQKDKIQNLAKENNININGAKIVDPRTSEKHQEYVELLYNLRKHKGMTIEQAEEFVNNPVYFGTLMLKDTNSEADGLVSGAAHSTSDTLRPALQILKTAPGTKLVSAFFVMVVPDCEYGDNGTFIFGDSGLNENPDDEKLSEIAISSSRSFKQLVEKNNLKITDEALKKVESIIETSKKVEDFGNARYINQIYQDILIEHSRNVENIENDENLMVITEEDINAEKLTAKNEARRIGF